jgi:hypothetical protein
LYSDAVQLVSGRHEGGARPHRAVPRLSRPRLGPRGCSAAGGCRWRSNLNSADHAQGCIPRAGGRWRSKGGASWLSAGLYQRHEVESKSMGAFETLGRGAAAQQEAADGDPPTPLSPLSPPVPLPLRDWEFLSGFFSPSRLRVMATGLRWRSKRGASWLGAGLYQRREVGSKVESTARLNRRAWEPLRPWGAGLRCSRRRPIETPDPLSPLSPPVPLPLRDWESLSGFFSPSRLRVMATGLRWSGASWLGAGLYQRREVESEVGSTRG